LGGFIENGGWIEKHQQSSFTTDEIIAFLP
jgi:hypothetical protein